MKTFYMCILNFILLYGSYFLFPGYFSDVSYRTIGLAALITFLFQFITTRIVLKTLYDSINIWTDSEESTNRKIVIAGFIVIILYYISFLLPMVFLDGYTISKFICIPLTVIFFLFLPGRNN